jgi:hypothetical protein
MLADDAVYRREPKSTSFLAFTRTELIFSHILALFLGADLHINANSA